ncbi:hypothetical protein ACEU8V_000028 [Escherichia coli]|nr:hypothetical protein [Escherichia coli]HCQ0013141.1 hypothetical protein [Escherichia coli]
MNIKTKILTFLMTRPHACSREIAENCSDYRPTSVQREVLKQYSSGVLGRFKDEDHGVYAYFLAEKAEGPTDAPVSTTRSVAKSAGVLAEQAMQLQKAGKFQRAATLWLRAFDVSREEKDRQTFLKNRQLCLRLSRYRRAVPSGSDNWCLAGRFAGECL